jgi:hypothetical protein
VITNRLPTDWRDLQNQVGQILEECGFDVEIERKTSMARGQADIDVYARETRNRRTYTVLCECKNWKTAIPQTVVHSFRNVVIETGANIGYVISSKGYQSGAFEAADLTNLKLLTWEQFHEEFQPDWLDYHPFDGPVLPRLVGRKVVADGRISVCWISAETSKNSSNPERIRFFSAGSTKQPDIMVFRTSSAW